METAWLIFGIFTYLVAAKLAVARLCGRRREIIFASLNLAGFYFVFVRGKDVRVPIFFAAYFFMVLAQYLALHMFAGKKGRLPWLAFFSPIFFLVCIRYLPAAFPSRFGCFSASYFFGISYLAFRTSRLVLEVRNGLIPRPSVWQYLSFCFFVPTMTVGPINSYVNFQRGFETNPPKFPFAVCAMRILVGLVKLKFFGAICNQLSYSGLLKDGYYHPWIDLPVAIFFYYLYLYCNFSGFCDMAIGAAGIIGIPVPENFDNPFAARNVKDFWNRWHITLSTWMRDVVFSPLSKYFVGKFGIARADHAIALTIVIVFLLVGVWHGVGWNFAAYGAVHALGVVANHYYTIWLKKRLGREKFKAYNENRLIRAVAVVLTFCYCGASLIFFANTCSQIREIFSILH
jgi:D-alanyl-lipoteichoic acid acyltransferase DltB (MBOAT superfamily)